MRLTLLVAASLALTALPPSGVAVQAPTERVVVDLSATPVEQLQDALEDIEGEIVRVDEALSFAVVLTSEPEALASRLDATVQPDARGSGAGHTPLAHAPSDTRFATQWGPQTLNMPQAWNVEPGQRTVRVAVVDSGIEADHPDLLGTDVTLGHDYVGDDEEPFDRHDHGTHVAGIVAATRDNGLGIAGMADVELYVVRVLDHENSGYCSDFASGVLEAAEAGADVINLSLYCNIDWGPLHDAIEMATEQGSLVVVAAGNFQTSNPSQCVTYPASYPEAMAVAAQDPTLTPATYSCQGPELEIAAPGSQVFSTVRGGGYAAFSGTSMATPHVAGAAALLLSDQPSLEGPDVRERLTETARDLGPPGHDELYGHGMLDPVAALTGAPATT